ncbi:MAG TPA: hypothetical protein VJ890_15590 [Vineibacter sp.]|nr:hypothetical protein [Vineibacter sp.]
MEARRTGIAGALTDEAVDMPLVVRTSLRNTGALPASPWPLPRHASMNLIGSREKDGAEST